MSRFVPNETDALALGDGDVIHIKRRLSYGDQRAFAGILTSSDRGDGLREYLVAVLERAIVRWEGPGFAAPDGSLVAITRDTIDALDPDVADLLMTEITTRNPVDRRPLAPSAPKSRRRSAPAPARSRGGGSSSTSASDTDGPTRS